MVEHVVLLPEALNDATRAYHWYEERAPGLGDRFLGHLEECIERIRTNPELHELVCANYRRAIVRRFPYVVFYEYEADTVTVYSVFHSAQDPEKWRRRLK